MNREVLAQEPEDQREVRIADVLSAMSYALDLTEGAAPGHTLRSCMIGMRVGAELGITSDDQSALFYALLLKDAGCSSNAARMSALFGSDDQIVKRQLKVVDQNDPLGFIKATVQNTAIGIHVPTLVERRLVCVGDRETDGRERVGAGPHPPCRATS